MGYENILTPKFFRRQHFSNTWQKNKPDVCTWQKNKPGSYSDLECVRVIQMLWPSLDKPPIRRRYGETHSIDNEYRVSTCIRKHFNDTFLALHYRYSQLLARAYLHNQTHDKNFKKTTEIGMKRAFWLCKYLNFDKMRRMGGLSREGHI